MSKLRAARIAGILMTMAVAAQAAGPQANFRRLHGMETDLPALVERLTTELEAGMALPGHEGAAYLRDAAMSTLFDFPDMPVGFRALLQGARAGSMDLEHGWHSRAVIAHAFDWLIGAPDAFAVPGPEVFPRVLRNTMRRGHMTILNYAEKWHVLSAGLEDLATHGEMMPDPLHAVALEALLESVDEEISGPAAALLVLARGAASLYPQQGFTGRQAFLHAALRASGENAPMPLARAVLSHFALVGSQCEYLGDGDRAQLAAAHQIASLVPDDAEAVQILRSAMEGLSAFPGA